jgi:hypothetical protein
MRQIVVGVEPLDFVRLDRRIMGDQPTRLALDEARTPSHAIFPMFDVVE